MEGSDCQHSFLAPEWLKSRGSSIDSHLISSSYSDLTNYSPRKRSSSSKVCSLSRSYGNSGRGWIGQDLEKDIDDFCHEDSSESYHVNNTLSNRFEKDQLRRSLTMHYGRLHRTSSCDVSNPQTNHGKINGMISGVVGKGIMYKSMLDEEFPSLAAEGKYRSYDLERMLSSNTSTSSHALLTNTSAMIAGNGITSVSHEIPVMVGNTKMAVMMHQYNDSASTSTSIAPRTMGLNMAETLAQGPPRSQTPPQLSVSPQRLEELALKQSRLLIPMTPSTPRSLASSSLEKSKVKTGQPQHPFSHSHSPIHHGAHPNSHKRKIVSGNSLDVSASRELNGVSLAAKDNLNGVNPNGRRGVLSPVGTTASISNSSPRNTSNATSSVWITLEKRPTFQTQSRSDFLKNLSRKSSSKKPSSGVFPIDTCCALEKFEAGTTIDTSCLTLKSRDVSSMDTSAVKSLTENRSIVITQNGNVACEPLKFPMNHLYSEVEEIAFLRSLGWEENAGDDEGLTEEEIRDFYEKYAKLQLLSKYSQKCASKQDCIAT